MNVAAASCGFQKNAIKIIPKVSPPNVSIGGPVPVSPGSRLKHAGMTVFGKKISSTQQAAGN
jgi:hypothetical protein